MRRFAFVFVCLLLSAAAARADDPPVGALDCLANPRQLDTLFARYGFEPLKTMRREERFMHFVLPEGNKETKQTGMYSYVGLSGDFTVEAKYVWNEAPEVRRGYGMSCGIAIDTFTPAGNVFLLRSFSKNKGGSGYAIVWEKPAPTKGDPPTYDTKIVPTKALSGRLAIKREKKELICLAGDDRAEPAEIFRIEDFTAATVRQVRLYADPGGSPTRLDAWLGNLRVEAEEITGGFPKRERKAGFGWWPILVALAVLGGLGGFAARRGRWRRGEDEAGPRKKLPRVPPKGKSKIS